MTLIDGITVFLLAGMTMVVGYLYLLALWGMLGRKDYPKLSRPYDFLILIPAHNEAQVIERTLASLSTLKKTGRVEIAVIADNCDDPTAEIARSQNVTVLERKHETERGKGYALEWAIAQFDLANFSAVAIIDADTTVESNMLESMACALETGAGAVQLFYEFTPDSDAPLAHLQNIASVAENIFFYRGRSVLRLPILLRGTGMAIRSEVLQTHPWNSHSVTEDVDYAVGLLKEGVKIDFFSDSRILSAATSTYEQSYTQKERWASGTFNLITDNMWPLIGTGLARLRFDLLELAFSLLLLSRPTLIFASGLLLLPAIFSSATIRPYLLAWPLVLILLLIVYLCSGVFFVRDKKAGLKALMHAPFFGVWLLVVQARAFARRRKLGWTRTKRSAS